jgi:hypothetical protein
MHAWIDHAKRQGWTNGVLSLLDIIEPFAPLVGQGLLVVQPMARVWGANHALYELAKLLEEPDGIHNLRQQLRQP